MVITKLNQEKIDCTDYTTGEIVDCTIYYGYKLTTIEARQIVNCTVYYKCGWCQIDDTTSILYHLLWMKDY